MFAIAVTIILGTLALGVAAYHFRKQKGSKKIVPLLDLRCQSVETPNGGGSRVNAGLVDGRRVEYPSEDATTLYQVFRRGVRVSRSQDCLGIRKELPNGAKPYHWISYQEYILQALERSQCLAAGLMTLEGVDQKSCIGIYAKNTPEWTITEQACYCYSMIPVALYDTLGKESCRYIISLTELKVIFVGTVKAAQTLIDLKNQCPHIGYIVMFHGTEQEQLEELRAVGAAAEISILTVAELEELGQPRGEQAPLFVIPQPDDLASICFTSGTTGDPKGVMLTHKNIVSTLTIIDNLRNFPITKEDTLISFLPLAHLFERMMQYTIFYSGGRIGFYSGDISTLLADMQELKPTIFPVVPRLLNRMYDKTQLEVRKILGSWGPSFIQRAVKEKMKDIKKGRISKKTLWDYILFKRIREGVGGEVRFVITGSAPVSAEVLSFIRCAMSCSVLEGYGQTEASAACTITSEGDVQCGHVGPPTPAAEIKLCDVPELKYYTANGQGEVMVRGPGVFQGYYRQEEVTRRCLKEDGWYLTGDVGEWTDTGCLRIIDRKSAIFKLAQGEFVSPEKVESVYNRSPLVAQVFVDGRPLKASLVAIIVPQQEVLCQIANEQGIQKPFDELCKDERMKKRVLHDIIQLGAHEGLGGFEQVKDIYVDSNSFQVENGLLTPTLKPVRPQLKHYYKEQLDKMNEKLP